MGVRKKVKIPSTVDAILQSRRLEILHALALSGPQTVGQLAASLPSMSQAALYRHVKILETAGALFAREIRTQKRGAPETVYSVVDETTTSLKLRGEQRSAGALRKYFTAIQAALLAAFDRRLQQGPIPKGKLAMRSSIVYLNPDELVEVRAMLARLRDFEANRGDRRKPFSLNVTLFPIVTDDSATT